MTDELLRQILEPDEQVQVEAHGDGARLLVTDRRIAIVSRPEWPDLDIPFDDLRRVQFDIERERPATLVIVPEHPSNQPRVLAIPPEQYAVIGKALAAIGRRLAGYATDEAPA